MAYESPISIVERITRSATEEMEDTIARTVSLHLDVTVNKEELKKALDYDRQQYQRGYADAESIYKNKWIPVSERLPRKNVEVLATTEWGAVTIAEMYSANDWLIHEGTTNADTDEIVAWMPLPEPYKESE